MNRIPAAGSYSFRRLMPCPSHSARVEPTPPLGSVEGNGAIPPLESGDRLSRDEFERRYDAMPGLKKAELIAGVVQVPSPVRQRDHSGPHFNIVGWLFLYRARTPGVEGGDNASVGLGPGKHAST